LRPWPASRRESFGFDPRLPAYRHDAPEERQHGDRDEKSGDEFKARHRVRTPQADCGDYGIMCVRNAIRVLALSGFREETNQLSPYDHEIRKMSPPAVT
jgi:hypothetical protein